MLTLSTRDDGRAYLYINTLGIGIVLLALIYLKVIALLASSKKFVLLDIIILLFYRDQRIYLILLVNKSRII